MNEQMGLKRLFASFLAIALLALACTAQAAPVFTFAGASAAAGGTVALRFSGDVGNFAGADLQITFDDAFLTYAGTSSNVSEFNGNIQPGLVMVTLLSNGPDGGAGPEFNYFDIFFMIKASAMGSSAVRIGASELSFEDGSDLGLLVQVNDLLANVTVDAVGVPIGSTSVLSLSALALLALSRRRASRLLSSPTALATS